MPETEPLTHPDMLQRQRLIEAVVDEFEQPLLRYATRILRNGTLAQDVVQNVFVKLFRQWQPNQRPNASLKPWLFRVTHNEAVDVIRAEERRKGLHQRSVIDANADEGTTPPSWQCHFGYPSAGGECSDEERRQLVFASLEILTLEERQVVLLRLQQGMSYDEIGVVMNRPRGSVGAILHVAVKKLADVIGRKEGV